MGAIEEATDRGETEDKIGYGSYYSHTEIQNEEIVRGFYTCGVCRIVSVREEENDRLLTRMQSQIDSSLSELKEGVDSMRVLFDTAK